MPRRKMTEEEKQVARDKKVRIQVEKNLEAQLERLKKNRARRVDFGPPIHVFKVGQRVDFGSHDNAEVLEVVDDFFYKVRAWGTKPVYGKPTDYETTHWMEWCDLGPDRTPEENAKLKIFSYRDEVQLNFATSTLFSVYHMHQSNGVDLDPSYQRDHVWTMELRRNFIDSIFDNVDLGKMVFRDRGYRKEGPMYEVIDGKQRLTTLILFLEGRITWRGRTFFDLSNRDQGHLTNYTVQTATITGPVTEAVVLRLFLRLNTGGVAQDPKHIAAVRARLEALPS